MIVLDFYLVIIKNLFLFIIVVLLSPNCLVKAEDNSDFFELIKKLSNWERWGEDDELGTLNLITPQVRISAAKEVTEGRTSKASERRKNKQRHVVA